VSGRRGWWIALAAFLAVTAIASLVRPMQVPDEARYGIIPAQMVETGDWLQPRLAGFRFYEKPPLVYWLTAASIRAFGEHAWSIRLPSVLATGVTCLVAAWVAVRATGRRDLGPSAFLVQATTIGPMVLGSVATLDPTFAALVACTHAAFLGACTSHGRARSGWLALAGVAAGFAFLAKGLLAFAIPGATALVFLAWERRWRDMLRMPWIPLVTALVTLAPFAWAVESANPGFWSYLVMKEHVRRALNPDPTQQPQPWWFYAVLFPVGAMMWTLAWPRAAAGLRDAPAQLRSGVRFALCWALVPLAALTLSSGKLATYMLPMYAPVAVLVAIGLAQWRSRHGGDGGASASVARWILRVAVVVIAAVAVVGPDRLGMPALWLTHGTARLLMLAVALTMWAILDAWSWRANDPARWVARTALAPVPMLVMIPFLYPTALLATAKNPWEFLDRHRTLLQAADELVVAGGSPALAASWDSGRRDLVIAGWADEFDNEMDLPEERDRRIEWPEVAVRVRHARGVANGEGAGAGVVRSITVLGDPRRLDELLATEGVPAPDVRVDEGNLAVAAWR
jgi:4-amino-4-deoxy-L-arabinose transferase